MSAEHTPGRLVLTSQDDYPTGCATFEDPLNTDVVVLYHDNAKADARRLVACWNACEGMEDPEAEIAALRKDSEYLMASERLRAQVNAQRDELLAALEGVLAWGTDEDYQRSKEWCDKARAAIVKATTQAGEGPATKS